MMTHKERFTAALERRPITGRVPHFELVFFLTMEAFGKVHPSHRRYSQWDQMEDTERQLHREDIADVFIRTAERFEHDAIFIHPNPDTVDETMRLIDIIRDKTGDEYFILRHGDATYSIPDGNKMYDFSYQIADNPQKLLDDAQRKIDVAVAQAETYRKHGGLDGFALCSDYCLNNGPFLSPRMFRKFVTPFLKQLIAAYREMGFYTIKHTDGDIMPILDQLVECKPHALHSLDPQAGVDIAEIKRRVGDTVALCGNVNCGLLDNGTDEQVADNVRYCLTNGMPGYGYIFCTSNCIYTGMRLKRYEFMLDIWRKEGNYPNSVGNDS